MVYFQVQVYLNNSDTTLIGSSMHAESTYTYTIDHDDRLISVSDGWNSFADNNGGAQKIIQPGILNKKIWDFIADDGTEYLYKELIYRVRDHDVRANVKIRCDSPAERRFLNIEMSNVYDGFIQFVSRIEKTEKRERIDLFDSDREFSDEMLRVCSYCKKIDIGNEEWEEVEVAINRLGLFNSTPMPAITHGVCPVCYCAVMAQLETLEKSSFANL